MEHDNSKMSVAVRVYGDRTTITHSYLPEGRIPPPVGRERVSLGLNQRQVTRLKRAGDYLQTFGNVYMYTLTFPDPPFGSGDVLHEDGSIEAISHEDARRRLSSFFKRVRRTWAMPDGSPLPYSWVAEIQPKRFERTRVLAIHFHVLIPFRIPIPWLREAWDGVNGCTAVSHRLTGVNPSYLVKYQAKDVNDALGSDDVLIRRIRGNRCGVSHDVSAALKVRQSFTFERGDWAEVADLVSTGLNETRPIAWYASSDYFLLLHYGFTRSAVTSINFIDNSCAIDRMRLSSCHECTPTQRDGNFSGRNKRRELVLPLSSSD